MMMSPVGRRSPAPGLASCRNGTAAVDIDGAVAAAGVAPATAGADAAAPLSDGAPATQLDDTLLDGAVVTTDEDPVGVGVGAAPMNTGTETLVSWPLPMAYAYATKSRPPF